MVVNLDEPVTFAFWLHLKWFLVDTKKVTDKCLKRDCGVGFLAIYFLNVFYVKKKRIKKAFA